MAELLSARLMSALPELRYQPTIKRVRVQLGDTRVVDTTRAVLIWEPMRVVASYAVPVDDLLVSPEAAPVEPTPEYRPVEFGSDGPPLLDPSVPFAVHTADGTPLSIADGDRTGAAFRLDDPDLAGYVILDFDGFEWFEEDEPIVGHARDPFHRIDVRRSSRRVRIEHEGTLLAESGAGRVLFEATFPMARFYVPRDDVVAQLTPGSLETTCAYKGHATHYDVRAGEIVLPNMAWSYEEPLDDAIPVRGLVSFYQERLDLWLDGEKVERVRTPWSS
jgi:uncharacterized protein (DUF427 family)